MDLEITQEVVRAGKSTPSEKYNDNSKKWKNRDCKSPNKTTKKQKAPDMRIPRLPPSKYMNYTDLVAS